MRARYRLARQVATFALVWVSFMAPAARAQVVRAFTPRTNVNLNGDITLIGNTIMTCNGNGQCANGHAGTGGNINNNDFNMQYVDVDADGTTFSSSSATLTVPATATATASGGVASFSGVGISGPVGPYTLTYSSSPVLTAPTQSIGLAAGVATQFSITTQPGGAASGSLLSPQPVLQLLDGAGNVVTQAGVDVTVSVASGSGTLSSGTLTVHTDATGKAIYTDLVITGADTYTLLFTASLLANPTKTSDPFVVTP